ncbi:hypothetical protein HXX01_02420 [Candidatus Nomurabacteria bacterium]|nr:hypothetical protein [Candidatus Nomurabacteria bacterium]
MKTLENHEKAEKVARILSIISGISIAIGIIAGILYLIFHKSWMDAVAVSGLTLFMLPFLALQIAMPANIEQFGTKSLGWKSLLFFLILFPFVDIWVLTGINALFHFIPDYHLITDRVLRNEIRISSWHQSKIWLGMIYFSLLIAGFIIRIIRERRQQVA